MKLATAHLSANDLSREARAIEHQIHELDRRGSHLTPPEEIRATELKKLRLLVKDRLAKS